LWERAPLARAPACNRRCTAATACP
jgi:hypothetical protein